MANTYSLDLEAGSSQFAEISDAAQTGLDITGDFTIEAWVKLETLPGNNLPFEIANKFDSGANNRSYAFRFFNNAGTHSLNLLISDDGSSNSSLTVNLLSQLSTGVWYHLASSYDADPSGTHTAYLNGVSQGTLAVGSTKNPIDKPSSFHIGAINATEIQFFDGLIDEARVWNDIRSGAEISANYQKELVGDEAGLVGYWKFNNDYLDATANDNDLTASGSPVFSIDVPFVGAVGTSARMMLLGVGR